MKTQLSSVDLPSLQANAGGTAHEQTAQPGDQQMLENWAERCQELAGLLRVPVMEVASKGLGWVMHQLSVMHGQRAATGSGVLQRTSAGLVGVPMPAGGHGTPGLYSAKAAAL